MSAGLMSLSGLTDKFPSPLTAVPRPWLLLVVIGTPSITTRGNVPDVMELTPRILTVGVDPMIPELTPTCTPAERPAIWSRKLGVASCEIALPFTEEIEVERLRRSC